MGRRRRLFGYAGISVSLLVTTALLAQQQTPELARQTDAQTASLRVAFGGRGRWLAEGAGGLVRIFNIEDGRNFRSLPRSNPSPTAFAAHPLLDLVAVGGIDGSVVVFDITTGAEAWRGAPLKATSIATMALEFGADGRELYAEYQTLRIGFRAPSAGAIFGGIFRRGGRSSSDGMERMTRRWSTSDGRELAPRPPDAASDLRQQFSPLKYSSDGSRYLVTTPGEAWYVVDARTGATIFRAPPSTPVAYDWAISPDGTRVATVVSNLLVVTAVTEQATSSQESPRTPVGTVTVGELDAARVQQQTQGVAPPPELVARMAAYSAVPRPLAGFTSDGRWLVARALDGRLDVWDLATGNRLPFRLDDADAKPELRQGPLVVRSRNAGPGPAGEWAPLEVVREPAYDAFWCRTRDRRFIARRRDGDPLSGVLVDAVEDRELADLLLLNLDLHAGCSLSPDGKRIVVAGMTTDRLASTSRPQRAYGEGLFNRSTKLMVVDVTSGAVIASLQDRSGAAASFPFPASNVEWSADGSFLAAGGNGMPGILTVGPIRAWHASTGRALDLSRTPLDRARRLRFLAEASELLVVPEGQRAAEAWSLATQTRVRSGLDANVGMDAALNERVYVQPGRDGLEIRLRSTGASIGEIGALRGGEWLVTTSTGLFDGSPGGWNRLAWRTEAGIDTLSGEQYFAEFYRPGLLAQLLDGRVPPAPSGRALGDRDRRQPSIMLSAVEETTGVARVTVSVREATGGDAAGASGMRDLRMFRNGSLTKIWRGDLEAGSDGTFRADAMVPLVRGENRLTAYAFNRDNVKSLDAETFIRSDTASRPPVVYLLAIGVNQYANPRFNLTYAVPDAMAFVAEVSKRQQDLGTSTVRTIPLLDREATRANILLALARLNGTQSGSLPAHAAASLSQLDAARPEDTVIVYFAGHGMAHGERFHLIPTDVSYMGSVEQADAAIDALVANGISDVDLERMFTSVDAAHIALIIDACQSGQALGDEDARFGPMNSRGLAQLAYEKGMSILAASQAYQAALESAQLGHGFLTFALVQEGLTSAVADTTPTDGVVTVDEWFSYAVRRVPQLQVEAMEQARQQGRTLRFDVLRSAPEQRRVQTPRAFLKRDAPGSPLIIARPR